MTPSLFLTTKQETYRQHVAAGQGAGITLVAACGEYVATFDCATRCASVLGWRGLETIEQVPTYKIPLPDMHEALEKLSQLYSVALVDYCQDRHGARFVLVWRIAANTFADPRHKAPLPAFTIPTETTHLFSEEAAKAFGVVDDAKEISTPEPSNFVSLDEI